jgi:outer membrane receptor for ferrienterochelin and colicins
MKRVSPSAAALLGCCLGVLATATPGSADEAAAEYDAATLKKLSLEDLAALEVPTVQGASLHEQKVTEAPSAVTVITADDIAKYGYRTFTDILSSVPGLYVRDDHNYGYVGVRGFARPGDYNTHVLMLVDGHRINETVGDQVLLESGGIVDVDLIERVEIIRGPGSSLYGSNAFLGVINVITRRPAEAGHGEVAGSIGSRESYKGRATLGHRFANGAELLLSGSYFDSVGARRLHFDEFDRPTTQNGVVRRADGDESGSAFASGRWGDFRFQAAYAQRTKQIPTASFGTVFGDPRTQTRDVRAYADLSYQHLFGNGIDLTGRLGYDRYDSLGRYIYQDDPSTPRYQNIDDFMGQWITTDLQIRRTFFSRHAVTAGFQLIHNLDQNQKNSDLRPAQVYLNDRRSGTNYAFFLQDEWRITDQLLVNAGVRYDHRYLSGSAVSPRVGIIYMPFASTSLKLLYGQAFRSPSPTELFYQDGGLSQLPSPNLKPEKITTYELVAEQELGRYVRATATGFYYEVKDLLHEGTDAATQLIKLDNLGSATAAGFDLTLDARLPAGIRGRASYSFTDALDGEPGVRSVNAPLHLAKLNLIVPLHADRLFASAEVQYGGARQTLAGRTLNDFTIANLTVFARDLLPGLDLSASLYNLFDEHYAAPGGPELVQDRLTQEGRSFRLRVTYRF